MAAGDFTTLPTVKQWLNVKGETDDALLTRLISAVSQFIQTWLGRQIMSASHAVWLDGTGGQRLLMPEYPVTAVASLTVDGVTIPASTGALVSGYTFDDLAITLRGYRFERGLKNVYVVFTAGYASAPVEMEQAALELIALRFAERLRPGVTSKNLGGESVSYADKGMTDSIQQLLRQYRRVVPL